MTGQLLSEYRLRCRETAEECHDRATPSKDHRLPPQPRIITSLLTGSDTGDWVHGCFERSVISPLGFSPATQTAPRTRPRLRQEALCQHTPVPAEEAAKSMIMLQTHPPRRPNPGENVSLRSPQKYNRGVDRGHEGMHDSRPSELKELDTWLVSLNQDRCESRLFSHPWLGDLVPSFQPSEEGIVTDPRVDVSFNSVGKCECDDGRKGNCSEGRGMSAIDGARRDRSK